MTHRLSYATISVPSANVIANTVTKTKFSDAGIIITPNNGISTGRGKRFKLTARGYLSSKSSTPGTLGLSVMYVNSGDSSLGTATITLPAGLTNAGWVLEADVLVCATGSSQGRLACQGMFLLDGAGVPVSAGIVNAGTGTTGQIAPTNGTISNQQITLTAAAQFSVADVGNTVTMAMLMIEVQQ